MCVEVDRDVLAAGHVPLWVLSVSKGSWVYMAIVRCESTHSAVRVGGFQPFTIVGISRGVRKKNPTLDNQTPHDEEWGDTRCTWYECTL